MGLFTNTKTLGAYLQVIQTLGRSIQKSLNSMLISSGLNKNLWGEALLTACHILNRIPHKRTCLPPFEIWKGRSPNLSYFRIWGCGALVRLPDPKISKIGPKAIGCVLLHML